MPKPKVQKLTPKQKVFCEAYVTNGGNGAAAARTAGYGGSEDTIKKVASENLTKGYLSEYIAELRKKIEKDFAVTAEEIITDLRNAREDAKAEGDNSTRLRATELLGKTIGIFVDKKEVTITTPIEEIADRVSAQRSAMK